MGGWMGGWVGGCVCEWVDGWIGVWVDVYWLMVNGRMGGWWMNNAGWVCFGWVYGELMDWWIDRW